MFEYIYTGPTLGHVKNGTIVTISDPADLPKYVSRTQTKLEDCVLYDTDVPGSPDVPSYDPDVPSYDPDVPGEEVNGAEWRSGITIALLLALGVGALVFIRARR